MLTNRKYTILCVQRSVLPSESLNRNRNFEYLARFACVAIVVQKELGGLERSNPSLARNAKSETNLWLKKHKRKDIPRRLQHFRYLSSPFLPCTVRHVERTPLTALREPAQTPNRYTMSACRPKLMRKMVISWQPTIPTHNKKDLAKFGLS